MNRQAPAVGVQNKEREERSLAHASALQGLPDCEAVNWGMARYVLHEYIEAVARDSRGNVQKDPDPRMPVLQLVRSSEQLADCGALQHALSPFDELQLQTLPAARAWVLEHLDNYKQPN